MNFCKFIDFFLFFVPLELILFYCIGSLAGVPGFLGYLAGVFLISLY